MNGSIVSVHVGTVAPLGPEGILSGFVKRPVLGTVAVTALGLFGDEQADLRVHGGPEKAVYFYPEEHYDRWRALFPEHAAVLVPGGFGENVTSRGLDETTVCVGDVLGVGTARLQVTQPRQPCFKLGLRFNDSRLARVMVRQGLSGWYARVLEPGALQAEAPTRLLVRPNPQWPVARFARVIVNRDHSVAEWAELASLLGAAEAGRARARASLDSIPVVSTSPSHSPKRGGTDPELGPTRA